MASLAAWDAVEESDTLLDCRVTTPRALCCKLGDAEVQWPTWDAVEVGDTSLDGRVTAPSGLKKHLGKRANLLRWEKEADRGDRERGLSR